MLHEYRPQSILAALQCTCVIGGTMATATTLKAMGLEEAQLDHEFTLHFVKNWGFTLIVVPLAWTLAMIVLERRSRSFSKRYTIGSGMVLLIGMVAFFAYACARAGSVLVTMGA